MNSDFFILINALVSFISFLILQICIFRRISHERVLSFLVIVYIAGGVVGYGGFLPIWHSLFPLLPGRLLMLFISISFFLYGLISLIYTLALFGIIESSIRIRVLREIASNGKRGMTYKEILGRYNRDTIVRKRLNRFLASGDITYDGKLYHVSRRFSAFSIMGKAFSILWTLYRG